MAMLPLMPAAFARRIAFSKVIDQLAARQNLIFDHIEKLKTQHTDKYVVVDESRPELQRFRGLTGNVKTVNMSGRALVEFDGYNNIGWYDIDPTFLKIVDAPPPKVEAKE